jgi:hypothetical protein
MGARWTEARVVELRRRLAEGETASEIGAAMGLTRNAVLGKAHRLGLCASDPAVARARQVAGVRRKLADPEFAAKHSARMKALHADRLARRLAALGLRPDEADDWRRVKAKGFRPEDAARVVIASRRSAV